MAREFPEAQVVGVDLAPVPGEPDSHPPNCRFEVDDINLGLEHFEGQFDIVHIRLVGSGLKDFHKSMSDVEKCLKPGGLVLWVDIDYDLYSQKTFVYKPPVSELHPSGVWLQRPLYGRWIARIPRPFIHISRANFPEMRRSVELGGIDIHTMEKAVDEGLWDHPMLDPET